MHIGEEEREGIRRAYYIERKSQRQIAKESGRSREAVKQALEESPERRKEPQVYEPYREKVEAFLQESESLPPKQRYTSAKIYELISAEGYSGCESRIRP